MKCQQNTTAKNICVSLPSGVMRHIKSCFLLQRKVVPRTMPAVLLNSARFISTAATAHTVIVPSPFLQRLLAYVTYFFLFSIFFSSIAIHHGFWKLGRLHIQLHLHRSDFDLFIILKNISASLFFRHTAPSHVTFCVQEVACKCEKVFLL